MPLLIYRNTGSVKGFCRGSRIPAAQPPPKPRLQLRRPPEKSYVSAESGAWNGVGCAAAAVLPNPRFGQPPALGQFRAVDDFVLAQQHSLLLFPHPVLQASLAYLAFQFGMVSFNHAQNPTCQPAARIASVCSAFVLCGGAQPGHAHSSLFDVSTNSNSWAEKYLT